jgi:predicted transcriptional regulator
MEILGLKFGLFLLALLTSCINVSAHQMLSPDELAEYHYNLKRDGEALSRCLESPEMRELNARMLIHRDQTLRHIRKARSLETETETGTSISH